MGVTQACCRQRVSDKDIETYLLDFQNGAADPTKPLNYTEFMQKRSNDVKSEINQRKSQFMEQPQSEAEVKGELVMESSQIKYSKSLHSHQNHHKIDNQESKSKLETAGNAEKEWNIKGVVLLDGAVPIKALPTLPAWWISSDIAKILSDLSFLKNVELKYKSAEYQKLGPVLLPSSEIYLGQWKNSNLNGIGLKLWPNGQAYQGTFEEGLETGIGRFVLVTGEIYQGQVWKGKAHGKGEFLIRNKVNYEGDWVEGYLQGTGEELWTNGGFYKGEYQKGQRHGKGVIKFPRGSRYEGDFARGMLEGRGKC